MLILHYFQPRDELPNPRGDLSLSMSRESIALANKEVLEATKSSTWHRRKGWALQEVG